jgi:hypothetical protein
MRQIDSPAQKSAFREYVSGAKGMNDPSISETLPSVAVNTVTWKRCITHRNHKGAVMMITHRILILLPRMMTLEQSSDDTAVTVTNRGAATAN